MLKNKQACRYQFFKIKNKKHKYLTTQKKQNKTSISFLVKKVFKNGGFFGKKSITLVYKTIIKLFFFTVKYLKLLVYNLKFNKIRYSANFNKLKNKIVVSKFPSLKKQKKNKKIKKNTNLKKLNLLVIYLFQFALISFFSNPKTKKLNKIFIYSNIFNYLINVMQENIVL